MISQDLSVGTGATDWQVSIDNIGFIPKEVHVKMITAYGGTAGEIHYKVYSDLINDYLFSVGAPQNGVFCISPNLKFPISGPVKGSYKFQLRNVDGVPIVATAIFAELFFQLEFIGS